MPPPPPVVVVIEDQPELSRVIRQVLGAEGFEAVPVQNTTEALAVLDERTVEFLVSDIPSRTPEGEDALAEITEAWPDLPVVIVRSARSDDVPFFGPWRRDGSRVLLRRPFRIDDLVAVSREVHAAGSR